VASRATETAAVAIPSAAVATQTTVLWPSESGSLAAVKDVLVRVAVTSSQRTSMTGPAIVPDTSIVAAFVSAKLAGVSMAIEGVEGPVG
jgi:hypothetical protein